MRGGLFIYDIISISIAVIGLGLNIYALFKDKNKKNPDTSNLIQQIFLVKQINPNYDIQNEFQIPQNIQSPSPSNNDAIKNAKWKLKRTLQLAVILVYAALIINFIGYINEGAIHITSITDLTAIFYIPFRNTLIQLSIVLIAFCVTIIVRGWDKRQDYLSNLLSMKFFSFKIITDILNIVCCCFVTNTFLEKVNLDPTNVLYIFGILAIPISFLFQLMWILFTIAKLTKAVKKATNYEDKEQQFFTFVPAYILPFAFLALIIYIQFS